jgi:thiamine biosynthesis lipoprotein
LLVPPIFAVILGAACADDGELERYEASRPSMGTLFQITLYASDEASAQLAFDAAFARIEELNGIFSDYDSDSETNRLCRAAPMDRPVGVSHEMATVLGRSLRLSKRTDGAFDVTVGPLSRLWRRARRRKELPSTERLQQAVAATGYRHIRLDPEDRTVQLLVPDMRLDFGAIAKGFAADEAIATLRKLGVRRALVNAGGDIAMSESPPGQTGWRIGIAPLAARDPPSRFLRLANCGIATSGDAWQFVEIEGNRYSHIVDPRTGIGTADRVSVTVVARDCTTADSLASAVTVLGPQEGIQLVEHTCGASCLIVRVEDEQAKTHESQGFPVSEVKVVRRAIIDPDPLTH